MKGDLNQRWEPGLHVDGAPAVYYCFNERREWVPSAPDLNYRRVGHVAGHNVWVARRNGVEGQHLRPALLASDNSQFIGLSAAIQRLEFFEDNQFCGRCGAPTLQGHDVGLRCEAACGGVFYPQVAPSIIVLIMHGEKALLAHSSRFQGNMYSTLAGFVEAGESAEHAIHREVFEEVGLQVDNIRYHATQSWPFRQSLMMGYFADYKSGEIRVDGEEIVDAQWFTRDNLPELPTQASVSYSLISAWINRQV